MRISRIRDKRDNSRRVVPVLQRPGRCYHPHDGAHLTHFVARGAETPSKSRLSSASDMHLGNLMNSCHCSQPRHLSAHMNLWVRNEQSDSRAGLHAIPAPVATAEFEEQSDDGDPFLGFVQHSSVSAQSQWTYCTVLCLLSLVKVPQANTAWSLWGPGQSCSRARPTELHYYSFTLDSCYHSVCLVVLCEKWGLAMAELLFNSSTVRWYEVQHCIKALMSLGSHEDSLASHKRSLSPQDDIISGYSFLDFEFHLVSQPHICQLRPESKMVEDHRGRARASPQSIFASVIA
ncbi:hypothetical protein NQZ68_012333 [Dissostichus eleginoides]|nr:hypothetical protein NQZ68_012333 [Dissostichus eleginoides]